MPDKHTQGTVLFDAFVNAKTFKGIYSSFLELCEHVEVKPFVNHQTFYSDLKSKVNSWKAKSLWAKLDKRANRKEYNQGTACLHTNVLIIGAGPCGLRTAIELAMLGAKVIIVEKRNSFSRNNVLHLWPFLITDLRNLGAKKFFGKFCAGAIDHISIRQLQVILLKVALLLGVEVHYDVMFEELEEPPEDQEGPEKIGWRARLNPRDHPVSEFEFDVIVGADGGRNTLPGFHRKEFRGKLAIAITANFINRHTQADASVQEISGVAFIFNQQFFQDLKAKTGIDLENIVYYKDDTHYFVMTAKKQSLLQKGVIVEDLADTAKLLAQENVNRDKLEMYAKEAADFSTKFQLPTLDYALNHYGLPDIAMFDFTSIFQAKNAACVRDRNGHKLLLALVGDTLLEPFWPTGSGCARGFLGAFDAAWMIRCWASGQSTPLQCLAEREAIYRLLAQTTPENLHKDYDSYGIDPNSRYPVLKLQSVSPTEVMSLYDTKDEDLKKQFETLKRKETPKFERTGSMMRSGKLLLWCQRVTESYPDVKIENMTSSWRNGMAMCAIIHRYRPHLIDFDSLKAKDMIENNQLALRLAEEHLGIPPAMSAKDMASFEGPDKLSMVAYISRIYDTFKDEVPEGSTTNMNSRVISEEMQLEKSHHKKSLLSRLTKRMKKSSRKSHDQDIIPEEKDKSPSLSPLILKRKSQDRKDMDFQRKRQILGKSSESIDTEIDGPEPEASFQAIQSKVSGLREQLTAQFMTIAGVTDLPGMKQNGSAGSSRSSTCFFCNKHVYVMERMTAEGLFFHRDCFRCQHCDVNLKVGTYTFATQSETSSEGKFYCRLHFTERQRREEEEEKRRAEEERKREEQERRREEERKAIHTIPEDPLEPATDPRVPPPLSPSGESNNLAVPMEKKYKATPERIVLQNMYDQIHHLTEEEQASYNLVDGDESESEGDSDESSDSEELNEVQLKWMQEKLRGLDGVDMGSDSDYSDEDMDSDEESSEEESEEEATGESRQVSYHKDRVSAMTNAKMAWLSDTSPAHILPVQPKPSEPEPVKEDDVPMETVEEVEEKSPLRKISVDNGLSTLERKITTPRKEENKSWRDRMAKNYASFEDDLPYMKQSSVEKDNDQEGVEEDNTEVDRPQDLSLQESNERLEENYEEEGKDHEEEEGEDHRLSNNSSFTISTPESSVSDVPASPRSSIQTLSEGRVSTSPTKHLTFIPKDDGPSERPKSPKIPSVKLHPSDGGKTVESSTDIPKSPSPSPRSRSPVPSPRRKLPLPPTSPKPSLPKSPTDDLPPDYPPPAPPKTEEVKERSERRPYQSHYARSNRGIRSPMLASGNNSLAFNKIPGMDDIVSPENENNAGSSSPKLRRPDSPIEYPSPLQTDMSRKEREVPSSRLRSDKLEEIAGTSSPMLDVSSEGNFETPPPVVLLSHQSESSTDPGFHDTSTQLSEGCFSPDGSDQWHSASSEIPTFQYENGIPRSESHSKERKSRISLIRRDKKKRKGVRRNKGSSVLEDPEDVTPSVDPDTIAAGSSSEKKKSERKKRKTRSRAKDYVVNETEEAIDEREKRRSKVVPDIEGLIKGGNDGGEKQLPRLIRKLTVDPSLTASFDLDASSSEEEEEGDIQVAEEEEPEVKLRKGKGRRMWGKKFKAFNTKGFRDEKEKRKLEEEELNAKLTRRVQREARRQHRQQQLKRHRMAQEIQRQLQEAEVKQRELEARGVEVEKSLRMENGEEGVPEQDLMAQWFGLVNEKNALVRFESELMAQAWELELEDRHSHLEQEIRTRLAVDESKKSDEDKKVEALLLEEMLEVVEQRDAIVAWLEEERLKEKNEDQDIESMMLQKGLLTAVQ